MRYLSKLQVGAGWSVRSTLYVLARSGCSLRYCLVPVVYKQGLTASVPFREAVLLDPAPLVDNESVLSPGTLTCP